MAAPARSKVVYVLPHYDADDSTHQYHRFWFIYSVAVINRIDIDLVIERGGEKDIRRYPPGVAVFPQSFRHPVPRFLELLFLLARRRCVGRRFFYVNYSFYGGLAAWLIVRLTGGTVYYWNAGMPWLYHRAWLREQLFRFILHRTTLVTGTAGLAERYRQRYQLTYEPRIIPNWIDASRFRVDRTQARKAFKPAIPDDADVVLFIHRLSRRKGADLLPEIASAVIRQRPHVRFLIVGAGPEREAVETRVRAYGISGQVQFFGAVANYNVPRWYCAADVLIVPSEEEGFPHVVLEAMAAGIPYIASAVGGIPELTPSDLRPWLIYARSPEAFASKILDFFSMPPDERRALGAVAAREVQRYDLAAVRRLFVDLFR